MRRDNIKGVQLVFMMMLVSFFVYGQEKTAIVNVKDRKTDSVKNVGKTFSYVEQMPEFPGGDPMLLKFISSNIEYPKYALRKGLQGTCMIQFIINTVGEVKNVKVLKGVPNCPQCDEEAVRVVSMSPRWKPGKSDGTPANVYYTVPIRYVLRGGNTCF